MKKISGIQSGVAGEYFVAAELSRRGYLCSITLKNTKGVDILVSNENSSSLVGVQVKTNNSDRKAWLLNKKAENLSDNNLVYVFTNLKGIENLPDLYIVESRIVAEYVTKNHQEWLDTLGKKGQKHKDSPMRMFRDEAGIYKGNWQLFERLLNG